MPIKYQITPKYILWRIEKILCNLAPTKKLRNKLKQAMPRKWHVISFSPEDMAKYQEMLKSYPDVLSPEETLDIALQTLSFSRIGDGEFNNIAGHRNSFNQANPELARRLTEICESGSSKHCLVCLNNYKLPKEHRSYKWFVHHGTRNMETILQKVRFKAEKYGDAYFILRTSQRGGEFDEAGLARIKSLWNNQKVLFVCNSKSPIIQDELHMFDEVAEKAFFHIPDQNAFDHYSEILAEIKKYDTSWRLYLEAGATASVLAWDLSKEGYHAFDMGDFYKRSEERTYN